jgi:hypothetical protein
LLHEAVDLLPEAGLIAGETVRVEEVTAGRDHEVSGHEQHGNEE